MISWDRARQLQDEVGADEFEEVVDLFIEEVDEVVTRMVGKDTCEDLEADLHFIKGSALSLGFETLSDLYRDGEKLSAEGHQADVDLAKIAESFETSKTLFVQEWKTRLAG